MRSAALQDSALFYFKTRQEASKRKLYGCIPLENAKIEVEAATGATATTKQSGQPLHFITITLHTSHALTCQHPFYVLAAPSAEIQMAWVRLGSPARCSATQRDAAHDGWKAAQAGCPPPQHVQ